LENERGFRKRTGVLARVTTVKEKKITGGEFVALTKVWRGSDGIEKGKWGAVFGRGEFFEGQTQQVNPMVLCLMADCNLLHP